MNKKGLSVPFLAVITTLILVGASLVVMSSKLGKTENYIGTTQFYLHTTYEKGEKFLFFVDESARLALKDTLTELSWDGGYASMSPICGDYFGYPLWVSKTMECYPINNEYGIEQIFEQKFNEYLDQYPRDLPNINYDIQITQNGNILTLTGKADTILNLEIRKDDRTRFKD